MPHAQPEFSHHVPTPLHQGLSEIVHKIDQILRQMYQDAHYMPQRAELDGLSKKALELVKRYKHMVSKEHKNLLKAVIDLTEIPVMHPAMQKVAFQVALKDAEKNIREFLSNG